MRTFWAAVHMIGETARHAGHADIVREATDALAAADNRLVRAVKGCLIGTRWATLLRQNAHTERRGDAD